MTKRLLVADDSLTIQKVIRLALSHEGYEIQAVSSGDEALQHITHFKPHCVLIDISLPSKNAFEIKKLVNQNSDLKNIPFILLSSAFEKVDESLFQSVQMSGRLSKPFDPSHLRETLKQVLKNTNEELPSIQDTEKTSIKRPERTRTLSRFIDMEDDISRPIEPLQDFPEILDHEAEISPPHSLDSPSPSPITNYYSGEKKKEPEPLHPIELDQAIGDLPDAYMPQAHIEDSHFTQSPIELPSKLIESSSSGEKFPKKEFTLTNDRHTPASMPPLPPSFNPPPTMPFHQSHELPPDEFPPSLPLEDTIESPPKLIEDSHLSNDNSEELQLQELPEMSSQPDTQFLSTDFNQSSDSEIKNLAQSTIELAEKHSISKSQNFFENPEEDFDWKLEEPGKKFSLDELTQREQDKIQTKQSHLSPQLSKKNTGISTTENTQYSAGLSEEQMTKIIQQSLEKMAMKILPEVAERVIKQEIHKLLQEQPD